MGVKGDLHVTIGCRDAGACTEKGWFSIEWFWNFRTTSVLAPHNTSVLQVQRKQGKKTTQVERRQKNLKKRSVIELSYLILLCTSSSWYHPPLSVTHRSTARIQSPRATMRASHSSTLSPSSAPVGKSERNYNVRPDLRLQNISRGFRQGLSQCVQLPRQ